MPQYRRTSAILARSGTGAPKGGPAVADMATGTGWRVLSSHTHGARRHAPLSLRQHAFQGPADYRVSVRHQPGNQPRTLVGAVAGTCAWIRVADRAVPRLARGARAWRTGRAHGLPQSPLTRRRAAASASSTVLTS